MKIFLVDAKSVTGTSSLPSVSYGSFYTKIWQGLSSLETDPYPSVAYMAHTLMDHIRDQVIFSCLVFHS